MLKFNDFVLCNLPTN